MPEMTQISGENNQGVIAGRDIYLGDQYAVQETSCFEPSLKEVEPPEYPSPPKARELMLTLLQQRLLILSGVDLDEKSRIARHIAWLLREELSLERRTICVREWYRSSDPQKIETAFLESEETLLLLPQIQPHHLGYRLNDLLEFVHVHQHYAIITTDSSADQWRIADIAARDLAWCELSWDNYYGLEMLTGMLAQKLQAVEELLPPGVLPLDVSGELVDGLLLMEVAASLKKPERIDPFVRWLLRQEPPVLAARIRAHLEFLAGEQRMVESWYQGLDRQNQILAIGLLFFDGLPDDQVFAGLEGLVTEAWRGSDPFLTQFDYQDLQQMGPYFGLVDAGADGTQIEVTSPQRRRDLMRTIWKLQRRRVLATLPALTTLVKRSGRDGGAEGEESEAEGEPARASRGRKREAAKKKELVPLASKALLSARRERELYGSGRRGHRLREAMIEILSEVGLLALEPVEPFLLDLVCQGTPSIQKLVARSLAGWRAAGRSDEFLGLIHKWWAQGCETDLSRRWIAALARQGNDPFASIRGTVALAVGYSVQYDPPNELSPRLVSLLEVLAQDHYPKVRSSVLELTVPLALAWHLRQLEGFLRTRVELAEDLMHSIAFGMAMAFSLNPQETWSLLGRWLMEAQGEAPHPPPVPSRREQWLSTLALAYGYIQLEGDEGGLTPRQILSRLQAILAEEEHPYVRRHALLGIGLQAIRNFDLVAPMLDQLVSEVILEDRAFLVSILRQAYLWQRRLMDGGDARVEIAGHSYAIWPLSGRPITAIETLLFEWIETGDPVARQIAVQTFAALEATELERYEKAWTPMVPGSAQGHARDIPLWRLQRVRKLNPFGHLAVRLAEPGNDRKRAALIPLLAELIEMKRRRGATVGYIELQAREEPAELRREDGTVVATEQARTGDPASNRSVLPDSRTLLGRWSRFSGQGIQSLTSGLRRAVIFYEWRWAVVGAGLLLFLQIWSWTLKAEAYVSAKLVNGYSGIADRLVEWQLGRGTPEPLEPIAKETNVGTELKRP